MKGQLMTLKKHVLTGTSHIAPFTVAGDILFSLSVMFNPAGTATSETGWLVGLADIGLARLTLFVPVLDGYIVYSMADKPGLASGMTGAYLANSMGAGFLGGMTVGPITGVVVKQLERIELPISLKTLGSIFIYPLVGTFITGGIIVWSIGGPIAVLTQASTSWLSDFGDVGKVPLAGILGAVTAFNMGSLIDKVATLSVQTQVDTLPYLMGSVGIAICTPPIGMGIATPLVPKKYNAEEKEAGKAAILMGCVSITEGAIPLAANDPLRVIPSLIAGAVVGNIIPFLVGVLNHAPWGGLVVPPVVKGRIWYIIAVLAGGFVTVLMVSLLKKNNMDDGPVKVTESDGLGEVSFDEL